MHWKRYEIIVACFLAILIFTGCSPTRNPNSLLHPQNAPDSWGEESDVQIGSYKSVQQRDKTKQDPGLAAAVTISGGGYRAANFAIGAMLEFENIRSPESSQRKTNALQEVDYFSTVSGGGAAAGVYVSSLYDHTSLSKTAYSLKDAVAGNDKHCDPNILKHLRTDLIDRMAHHFELKLLVSSKTAGDLLEQALDDFILGYQWRKENRGDEENVSLKLNDMFVPKGGGSVKLPHWIANATAFENGAIFPFMPDHIALYKLCRYTHQTEFVFKKEQETYRDYADNIPMSLGLSASMKFPGIPCTTMKSDIDIKNRYLHLFDGAMSDNLGIFTALRILRKKMDVKRRAMIVVDVYNGTFSPFSETEKSFTVSGVISRVAQGHLDSWHGRHRELVRALCNVNVPDDSKVIRISPVFISFDDLRNASFDDVKKFSTTKDWSTINMSGMTVENAASPYVLARKIATIKLSMTEAEQDFLIAAGRYAVDSKKNLIAQAFWGKQ